MLLDLKRIAQVYLVCGRTDLRRGIDGSYVKISDK